MDVRFLLLFGHSIFHLLRSLTEFKRTLSPHCTMASTNEPADPIAKGILSTAKQSLSDLLKWKQRVVVVNDYGESQCEWQQPAPLQNPIRLFMQLSARDVSLTMSMNT